MPIAHASRTVLVAFVAVAAAAAPASPQAPGPNSEKLTIIPVQWMPSQPFPNAGKVAAFKGDTDTNGVALTIPAGTVFSRCAVVVKVADPSRPVKLLLKNELSTQWDRTALTDARGIAEIRYRTEGGAMVLVRSPEGRQSFELLIFQGNEIPVHKTMTPPFITMAAYEAKQQGAGMGRGTAGEGAAASTPSTPAQAPSAPQAAAESASGSQPVLWIIAGLLGALLIVGLVLVIRRRA